MENFFGFWFVPNWRNIRIIKIINKEKLLSVGYCHCFWAQLLAAFHIYKHNILCVHVAHQFPFKRTTFATNNINQKLLLLLLCSAQQVSVSVFPFCIAYSSHYNYYHVDDNEPFHSTSTLLYVYYKYLVFQPTSVCATCLLTYLV